MQLDRTHVVVRLRTMSEIGDLALIMIRRYPASCAAFAAGASVWAIANLAILGWIPLSEYQYGLDDEEALLEIWRYAAWMAVLVILQAPAAGVLMTSYLGQAVFEERPDWNAIVRESKRHAWRWIWILGVKRLAIPTMLMLALRWGQPASSFWDGIVPISILLAAVSVRGYRPFMPEILLLERCPLKSESPTVITVARRSKSLHGPVAGDVSGRFLAIAFVMCGLFFSLYFSFMFARGIITGMWNHMNLIVLLVIYPIALWMVACVSVLIRFLVYLDTRIRLEGWEVDLAMQAEAMRQFGDDSPTPPKVESPTRTIDNATQPAQLTDTPPVGVSP